MLRSEFLQELRRQATQWAVCAGALWCAGNSATAQQAPTAGYSNRPVVVSAPMQPAAAATARPDAVQPALPVCVTPAGEKKQEALQAAMKQAYQGVFYANNFSYLNDPAYAGPFFPGDDLKGLLNGKLDVGGEFRSRYHHENNMRGLGLTGVDDQFWLTRTRLFTNYRATDDVRLYGEYLYADSGGESFAPRPIEENRGEVQNLFVDATLLEFGDVKVIGRAGRQELLLGAQRLVSPLDWANTRRTFDGYRTMIQSQANNLDLFYTNPVRRVSATGGTNQWDSSNNNESFYGAYLSNNSLELDALEAYYIGYDNQDQNFSFHTLGSRLAGQGDFFLYETEAGVQFGDNANGSNHSAGFATAGLGRKLNVQLAGQAWKPTIWGWYDWASGGSGNFVAPGDGSFHHYFPLAHKYNGFMDLFGRRNLHDVNMQLMTPLGSKVNLLLWYHYFFLDQATTPYSVVMTPYNAGNTAVSKDLGHEIDLLFTINLNARNNVLVGYSHFDAGNYYTTPGVQANADADFFYCQYQTQF